MLVCCSRCLLMVNDETPISYLPDDTPGMIALNGAGENFAFRPSLAATALNRSTSKPMTVLPSLARNSLGAYVASVPTVMLPSAPTVEETFFASAGSADTPAAGLAEDPPPGELELLDEPPDPPQAASDRASVVAAMAASGSRDFVYRIVRLQSESVGTGLQRRLCGRCSTSKVRSRSAPG